MNALSAADLLAAWERGLNQRPIERALTLLAAFSADATPDDIAKLSIGRRDDSLLSLRERIFGDELTGLVKCPSCGEELEFMFSAADLRFGKTGSLVQPISLDVDRWHIELRLPNSDDLMRIEQMEDATAARRLLLESCILSARDQTGQVTAAELPQAALTAIVTRMGACDPMGDVQLSLACPACKRQWETAFDIASFLWGEIHAWAQRVLREVATLARVYGWREADILSMSAGRRQAYLELIG
jgi:hypothetical protein